MSERRSTNDNDPPYRPAKNETAESTAETLKFVQGNLDYDPETGLFTWKHTLNPKVRAGAVAGSINDRGYRTISINVRHRRAHRLAWLVMTGSWPDNDVDHINGNRDDNRWENLRAATRSQNNMNSRMRVSNVTGMKGVAFNKMRGTWQASIKIDGKYKHLGAFKSPEEAKSAYDLAANKHYGEFARSA
jgi:hypothetical protein